MYTSMGKRHLLSWVKYTITTLLIVVAVGSFILASQRELATSIIEAQKVENKQNKIISYDSQNSDFEVVCLLGSSLLRLSTDPQYSDLKHNSVKKVDILSRGYIVVTLGDGTMSVHSKDNCVVNIKQKGVV